VNATSGNNVDRAARWDASGAITELGDLSPGSPVTPRTRAFAVNESGTAVGYSQALFQGVLQLGTRAVRWDGSGTAATELGNLGLVSGRTQSEAWDINENGTAVGWAIQGGGTSGPRRAVRWDAGTTIATELGTLGGSAPLSYAFAINDLGTAIGYAPKSVGGVDVGYRAVRWDATGTTAIELGELGADGASAAYDINNSGIAVGTALRYVNGDSIGGRAVAWRNDTSAIDLNDLIDPQSGWTLTDAFSISDTGWITGLGRFDPDGAGDLRPVHRLFLLQLPPIPEPPTMLSWMVAVASLLTVPRRACGVKRPDTSSM
jgi:uncharacterized membrane protein